MLLLDFRKPYTNEKEPNFLEENAEDDPFKQFDAWFKKVAGLQSRTYEEINAVAVSTCV